MKAIRLSTVAVFAMEGAALAAVLGHPAQAQPAASAAGGKLEIINPKWAHKPSVDDIVKNYPDDALRRGHSGRAVVECTMDAKGYLHDCTVLAEVPKSEGFGKATLRITNLMQVSGAVAGAKVKVPVQFLQINNLPPPPKSVVTIDAAPWIATPSKDEIVASLPVSALSKSTHALVTMKCLIAITGYLRSCEVSSATPAGLGFEAAALSLSDKFKVDVNWIINVNPEVWVDIPVQFAAADDQTAPPSAPVPAKP